MVTMKDLMDKTIGQEKSKDHLRLPLHRIMYNIRLSNKIQT